MKRSNKYTLKSIIKKI